MNRSKPLIAGLPRSQIGVLLVEVLERLRCLGLERGLAGQALKDDGTQTPEVRFGVVLQGHDHLRCLGYGRSLLN